MKQIEINKNHIVLEGIDGCGKSTFLQYLENDGLKRSLNPYIKDQDDVYGLYFDRSPYDEEVTKKIRAALKESTNDDEVDKNKALLDLFSLDNSLHADDLNKIFKYHRSLVITDRYFTSTYAYQSLNNPKDKVLDAIKKSNVSLPGLILYFDIKPEVSMERVNKRGEEKEMFEKLETLYKVKDNYMEFFKKIELAHNSTIIAVIDANISITEVRDSAMQAIIDYIFMDRQTMFKSKKYKVLNSSSF